MKKPLTVSDFKGQGSSNLHGIRCSPVAFPIGNEKQDIENLLRVIYPKVDEYLVDKFYVDKVKQFHIAANFMQSYFMEIAMMRTALTVFDFIEDVHHITPVIISSVSQSLAERGFVVAQGFHAHNKGIYVRREGSVEL
ncbi:MAG: hypothetical protein WAZ18_03370 [Alphaproteobacteria bacterium]